MDPTLTDLPFQWFYTNAPAAWLSATVAIIMLLYTLWNRKRPNKIIVRLTAASSLISVWREIKEKTRITFNDQVVNSLGKLDLIIFNNGSEVIKDISLTLNTFSDSVALDVLVKPFSLGVTTSIEGGTIKFNIPYLNPKREHDQIIEISVLLDGQADPIKVLGGGQGWSVEYQPLLTKTELLRSSTLQIYGCIALFVITIFYGWYLQKFWGITRAEFSTRAILVNSPITLALLFMTVSIYRNFKTMKSRIAPRKHAVE